MSAEEIGGDHVVIVPPSSPPILIDGEFEPSEVERGPLDTLHKRDRDYTHVRHMFANDDQYGFFCMLPGGDAVKERVLATITGEHAVKDVVVT